jgi:hypothetical protein
MDTMRWVGVCAQGDAKADLRQSSTKFLIALPSICTSDINPSGLVNPENNDRHSAPSSFVRRDRPGALDRGDIVSVPIWEAIGISLFQHTGGRETFPGLWSMRGIMVLLSNAIGDVCGAFQRTPEAYVGIDGASLFTSFGKCEPWL